jgi:hypothetical protein
MTICSWMAQPAEMLMESIGRHAKLHIRYAHRKAVFVGVLVANRFAQSLFPAKPSFARISSRAAARSR